jgi:hypothetical protein
MDAELLVDSGANTELRLPARMVRQLGLEIRGSLLCRGPTNDVSRVLIFSSVLVEATFIRGGVQEKIQADLSPTKHRPHDAPYQQAVTGINGMKKLRLHLNSQRQQLEIEEDEVLDEY